MISKKSLIAAAVLSTMAAGAMAANVTLYGKIDDSFHFTNVKADGKKSVNTFDMKSGFSAGSRWGLKGVEEVGSVKVGFVLENGFTSDDGKLGQNSRLFGRQAYLYVDGVCGQVAAGRFGGLASGTGNFTLYNYLPFGSGWGSFTGTGFMSDDVSNSNRFDNSILYRTPKMAGFQVSAMYSLQADGSEKSESSKNQRYAGIGATYANGPFDAALVAETTKPAAVPGTNHRDGYAVTAGASYNLGVTKLQGTAQYAKYQTGFAGFKAATGTVDGWAVGIGAVTPVCGGSFLAQINYSDAETSVAASDFKAYGLHLAYQYPLSKRTSVYAAASYSEKKTEPNGADSTKVKNSEAAVGIVHNF